MDGRRISALFARVRTPWVLAGLGLFCLAFFFLYGAKIGSTRNVRSAFQRWHPMLRELDDGVDIWEKHLYPNPPIMALILKPLAELSPRQGAQVWFALKTAMLLISAAWIFRMLDRPEHPFPGWAQAIVVYVSLKPIEGDLVHGNVNLFILFLVAGGLVAFQRGRDWLAGATLGLATACKVTPALFLPYFIWKRQWKTATAMAASTLLFLFPIPAMQLGWDRNLQGLESWCKIMVLPYAIDGEITSEHQNQSLPGFLERMLTEAPSFTSHVGGGRYEPTEYHNLANLPAKVIPWLTKLAMLAFGLLAAWRFSAPRTDRDDIRWAMEFGIVLVGMLIFSERTWKHHCVTLMLPLAVILHQAVQAAPRYATRRCLAVSLTTATILMLSTSSGIFPGQDRFAKLAEVYGAYLWMFALLAGTQFALLRKDRAEVDASDPIILPTWQFSGEFEMTTKKAG
ncbi:MAG: glycosyltransferase family 87 protein [Gemmataceae bacterium]